jgi:uncharacterized protein (DUF2141 family)
LEFSEFVNADKLLQNLIITPKSDLKFKHVVKRNSVKIKFETLFEDSTTYSLNFFDGITDITENIAAVNLILAFSTGSYIDSMTVNGNVRDLLSELPSKKFIVGLYPVSDSLDFLSDNPMYFTTVNDSGQFNMSYIKTGNYRVLAFKDDNRNLLLDPKEEDHGFSADTIILTDSMFTLNIPTILQNVKPLLLVNNRPIRAYHEIKFNREIANYKITPDSIFSSITGSEKDILRIYNRNQFAFGDTTQIILNASDSLQNNISDTLKIVFNEDSRKPADLKFDMKYYEKTLINDPIYYLTFNKPVVHSNKTKLIYKGDSTFNFVPDSISFNWNENKTEVSIQTFINKDSIYFEQLRSVVLDSLTLRGFAVDSLQVFSEQEIDSIRQVVANKTPIEFNLMPGAFITVENDTSSTKRITHKKTFKQPFGTLKLNIETEYPSFIVQLLDSRKEVSYQKINNKTPSFDVKPATYTIRILIDSNNDGKWTYGNLLKNVEPEKVYLFPDNVSIRENWIVEDINISF